MKTKFLVGVLLWVAVAGCKGPQGDTGPRGDPGAQGVTGSTGSTGANGSTGSTGSQGPKGEIGPKGATGSQGDPAGALQFKLNQGVTTNVDGSFSLYVALTGETLRKANEGVVLLYMLSSNFWYLFPATLNHNGNAYSYTMRYNTANDKLNIECSRYQTTGVTQNFSVAFDNARIVIVPAMNARINYENYQEVADAYGLD